MHSDASIKATDPMMQQSMLPSGNSYAYYIGTLSALSRHCTSYEDQGPLLLTWFNFNPSMDK